LTGQLSQRVWERRTEIYLEVIRQTDIVDPHHQKPPEGFKKAATEARGEKVSLLPVNPDSDEWRSFEAGIEAFASAEVRFLYWLWDSAVAAWTFAMSAAIAHDQLGFGEYKESRDRVRQTYNMAISAREEIVAQIRAELRFESRQPGVISFRQEELMGYLTDLNVDHSRHETRPIRSSRLVDIGIDQNGKSLKHTIRLGEKMGEYPDRDSNAGSTA